MYVCVCVCVCVCTFEQYKTYTRARAHANTHLQAVEAFERSVQGANASSSSSETPEETHAGTANGLVEREVSAAWHELQHNAAGMTASVAKREAAVEEREGAVGRREAAVCDREMKADTREMAVCTRHTFSKVLSIVTLCSKCVRAFTFENV